MTDAEREELRKHVRALVHGEMRLLETYLTKRVMLMLEEVWRLQRELPEAPKPRQSRTKQ